MKGNIIITMTERDALHKAVISKYLLLTSKQYLDYKLNSNPSNYNELAKSIKEQEGLELQSKKPLVTFFWAWPARPIEYNGAFRKIFIEKLYEYAHGKSRKEFLKLNPTPGFSRANKNISGFWECYYDEDGTFQEYYTLRRFAVFIPETDSEVNNSKFYIFGMGNSLDCFVEVCSANLIFKFRHFKFNNKGEPAHVCISFGSDLRTRHSHAEVGPGIMSFLNEYACPTACVCLLKYFPERDLDYFNSLSELPDLVLSDSELSNEDRKIKNFFFNYKKSLIWAHAHHLK